MNTLWQIPTVVLAVLAWLSAPPSGLVDIAQRESFRRSVTQKAQASLSNLGLANDVVPASAVSMPPSEVPPPAGDPEEKAESTAKAGEKKPEEKKPDAPPDEAAWRQKMADLRAALEKSQLTAEAMQSRINALQSDAVSFDDPIKQTKARMDLVRTLEELDKTKKQIEGDLRAIAALQDQARRLNVPAGWIR